MAVGTYTSFYVFDEEFYGGFNETVAQATDAFNAASGGAIQLVPRASVGHAEIEAFFDSISTLVSRRDNTSTSGATSLAATSDDWVRPKLARKIGPVENTLDSLKKIGSNQSEFSFRIGEQAGKAAAANYLNSTLYAAQGAIVGNASLLLDKSGSASNTMDTDYLIDALELFGDAGSRIVAWVMHSKPFYNLMKEQAGILVDSVAGASINQGTVASLGRLVVVTDSAALVNTDGITSGTDSYYTLGLTEGGLMALQSEELSQVGRVQPGSENLTFIWQAEYSFNVGVKGYTYNDLSSTKNPTDANLGTAAKWTMQMADEKFTAGVAIESA